MFLWTLMQHCSHEYLSSVLWAIHSELQWLGQIRLFNLTETPNLQFPFTLPLPMYEGFNLPTSSPKLLLFISQGNSPYYRWCGMMSNYHFNFHIFDVTGHQTSFHMFAGQLYSLGVWFFKRSLSFNSYHTLGKNLIDKWAEVLYVRPSQVSGAMSESGSHSGNRGPFR